MKQLAFFLLSCCLLAVTLPAEESNTDKQMLQKLVQKVKVSQDDERRKAMNALKVKLRTMNQETRRQVMMDLQKNFSKNNQNMKGTGQGMTKSHGINNTSGIHTNAPSGAGMGLHALPHTQPPATIPGTVPVYQRPQIGRPGGHK